MNNLFSEKTLTPFSPAGEGWAGVKNLKP